MEDVQIQEAVGNEVYAAIETIGYGDGVALTAYNYAVYGLNIFNLLTPLLFSVLLVSLVGFLCKYAWWGDKSDLDGAVRSVVALFLASNVWQLVYALGWVLPWSPTPILLVVFALFIGWGAWNVTEAVSGVLIRAGKSSTDIFAKAISEEFKGSEAAGWFAHLHKDTRKFLVLSVTLLLVTAILHLALR